jgi:hypothetical protein
VADERTWSIRHVPMIPHETIKPGWEYPTTKLPEATPWLFRRYVMLVKHDPSRDRLPDYLVVRDEIDSPRVVWQNLHVLARRIEQCGQNAYFFPGQLDVDLLVHVFGPKPQAVEKRFWGWKGRGNERRSLKGAEYEHKLMGDLIPEDFQRGTWDPQDNGERGQWLRIKGPAEKSAWLLVLTPTRKGQEPPRVESLSDTRVRVSLGAEIETVDLGSDGAFQAAIERAGRRQVLLKPGQVKPWSQQKFGTLSARAERGKD